MATPTVTQLDDYAISEAFDAALPRLRRYNPDSTGAMRPARDGAYLPFTDVRALVIQMIKLRELIGGDDELREAREIMREVMEAWPCYRVFDDAATRRVYDRLVTAVAKDGAR